MLRSVAIKLTVLTVFTVCRCVSGVEEEEEEDHGFTGERMQLFQYDPVAIKYAHHVQDERGREMEVETAAIDPPVFEIHHFLSAEECNHLINLGLEHGIERSMVLEEKLPSLVSGDEAEILGIFDKLDEDKSNRLDLGEVAEGLEGIAGGFLGEGDVIILMGDLQLDTDKDDHLNFVEFKLLWTTDMAKKVREWVEKRRASVDTPLEFIKTTKVSDHTWLDHSWQDDEVLTRLHERVVKLLKLPREIVSTSEGPQVERQQPGGKHQAHHDSDRLEDTVPCAHTKKVFREQDDDDDDEDDEDEDGDEDDEGSRLCRFATLRIYLNDVEEGGETAFPFADNKKDVDKLTYDPYDLTNHCSKSNLVVKPEKGKAILWYNHAVTANEWMGDRREASLHGGCDVRKGEKWIANHWITVDDDYETQMKYHAFFDGESDGGDTVEEEGDEEDDGDGEGNEADEGDHPDHDLRDEL